MSDLLAEFEYQAYRAEPVLRARREMMDRMICEDEYQDLFVRVPHAGAAGVAGASTGTSAMEKMHATELAAHTARETARMMDDPRAAWLDAAEDLQRLLDEGGDQEEAVRAPEVAR